MSVSVLVTCDSCSASLARAYHYCPSCRTPDRPEKLAQEELVDWVSRNRSSLTPSQRDLLEDVAHHMVSGLVLSAR